MSNETSIFSLEFGLKTPDAVAIEEDSGQLITYGDLVALRDVVVQLIPKRSLTLVLCDNSIACIALVASLLESRVTPILLDGKTSHNVVIEFIERYKPEYLICSQKGNPLREDAVRRLNYMDFELCEIQQPQKPLPHNLALLLSTSGSTGSPKLVRISEDNLQSNVGAVIEYLGLTKKDCVVTSLPIAYTFGLSNVLTHLKVGGRVWATEKSIMERDFWNLFKSKNVSVLAGVPYTFQMLKRIGMTQLDGSSLRLLLQAGGKLSRELISDFGEYCDKRETKFFVMYGQTEATARMTYVPPEQSLTKAGSVGIAIPNGSVKILDEKNSEISTPNVPGQILYEGPNVAMGYAMSRQDLYKSDEWNSKLLTGDLGYLDGDGYLFVTGRTKRFVKVHGKRVNLDHLEEKALGVSSRVAITGHDDRIVIWSELTENADKIKSALSEELLLHPSVFQIRYVEELPRTQSGKIEYSRLKINQDDNT